MKSIRTTKIALAASYMVAAILLTDNAAQAAATINAVEMGGDVVFTVEDGSSLNVDGWTRAVFDPPSEDFGRILPSTGIFFVGKIPSDSTEQYSAPEGLTFTGPSIFGTGGDSLGTSGIGGQTCTNLGSTRDCGLVGLIPGGKTLRTPFEYVSGETLPNSTTTYAGASFASLGLDVGSYTWSWSETGGGNADSLTLNIVPEPGSISLIGLAILVLSAAARRRSVMA